MKKKKAPNTRNKMARPWFCYTPLAMHRRNLIPPLLIALFLLSAISGTVLGNHIGVHPTVSLNIFWTIASLWASATCFRTSMQMSEANLRRAWGVLGAGCTSWLLGQLLWDYQELILGNMTPFAGWQDVAYIATSPFFLAASYFFSGQNATALAVARKIFNLAILCCCTALVVVLLGGKVILAQHNDPVFLFTVLGWGVLMPTAFLGALLFLWLYVPAVYIRPVGLLAISSGLQAVAMVMYATDSVAATYHPGNSGDYIYLISFGLVVWAAREQRLTPPLRNGMPLRKTVPLPFLEPALPAVCMLGVLAVALWKHDDLHLLFPYMLPAMGALAVCVAVREAWNAHVERQLFEKLRESESMFRQVVDSNMNGIAFTDLHGNISDANDAFLDIIGYAREDLRSGKLRWDCITPPEYEVRDREFTSELVSKGVSSPYEKEYLCKDGTRIPVLIGGALLPGSRDRAVCFVIDLTVRKSSEKALQEMQARLQAALDHLPFAFWSMDRSGKYIYQNTVSLDFWGDQRGKRPEETNQPKQVIAERLELYQRAFAGEIIRAEASCGEGDQKRWYHRVIVPIRQDTEITGIFGVNVDFTTQKHAQLRLEESEARYRNLAEHSAVGIWHFDEAGRTVYANCHMLGLLGIQHREDLQGQTRDKFLDAESLSVWCREHRRLAQGHPVTYEVRLIGKDDERIPVLVSCVPQMHADGHLRGSIATFTDLRELKRARHALECSERRFRALVENASDGIAAWNAEGLIHYVAPSYTRLLGYTSEELQERPVSDFLHPEDAHAMNEAIRLVVETGQLQVPIKARAQHKNGNWRQCEGILTNLLHDPAVGALVVNYHDVTERQEAEDALRESEARLLAFMENSPTHMFIKDREGRYVHVNKGFLDAFGLTAEEIIGRTDHEIFSAEQAEIFTSSDRATLAAGSPMQVEERIEHRGVPRSRIVHKFPLRDVAGEIKGLGGVSVDISERARAEQALRLSEERYRSLVEGARDVIFTLSPEGMLTSVNPGAELITGIPNAERLDRPFLPMVDDKSAAAAMDAFVRVLRGEKVCSLELEIVASEGRSVLIDFTATPQFDGDKIVGVLGIGRDITERRQLEEELRHSQKMDSIGQLAGGVAHDFNNLLTVIQGNASLIGLEPGLPPEVIDSVEEIATAADRAATLTRQLLAFSRRQVIQARDLDLNEIVADLAKMLRRILGEDISLLFESSNNLPLIHADSGMMEQVLLNLAVNARDAMPNGGRLTISTGHVELSDGEARKNSEARAGHFVRVSVSDTGSGIAAEHLPHIFEPFFTTKDIGKGTGLGLATVYGIIKQHQGWISVQSTTGKGTCFDIHLPARALQMNLTAPETSLSAENAIPRGHETILVVEDEVPLRAMVKTILSRLGYCVIEAASAIEALKIWPEHRDTVDLVFTDMVMPEGMSGQQLAEELQKDKPGVRVLFTSGYSAQMLARNGRLPNGAQCLQKPYLPPALATAVRTALNNGTAETAVA